MRWMSEREVNDKRMREEKDLSNLGQEEEDEKVGAEETTEGWVRD